jgi:hypothetical protein
MSAADPTGDPALLARGWERRFTADAARATEVVELYRRLGYEVRTEPVSAAELGEDCDDCPLATLGRFQTIYTRKRSTDDFAEPRNDGETR